MRARIDMAFGQYWGGIIYAIDVIALQSRSGASAVSRHVQ
jgi:hypothetical protein